MHNAFHFWAFWLILFGVGFGISGYLMDRRASFDDGSFISEILVMMLGGGLLLAGLAVALIGYLWGG
jgi:hypothetical protein